jgi:ureidoglycolate hydrolase
MADQQSTTRYVQLSHLTQEEFAPFGHVIERSEEAPLARNEEREFWKGPLLTISDGHFMPVYVHVRRTDYVIRRLHRHRAFSQMLIPLEGKPLIHVVCPAGQPPDLSMMRAFLVEPSQAVITSPGIWHRNPALPIHRETSLILLSRDVTAIDAAASPGARTVGGDTDRLELTQIAAGRIRIRL